MPSPKPNTIKDLKVLMLRMKGLSFREIASHKEIGEDVKNVHMRYKRGLKSVGKLSTVRQLTRK